MFWSAALLASFLIHLGIRSAAGEKTAISQQQFDTFKRYTEISAAAYASECPNPPQGIEIFKRINNGKTDTQGFIARDAKANEMIVAFRGSSSMKDFLVDLNTRLVPFETKGVSAGDCNGCKAHDGILKAWNSVADETIQTVQAELEKNPGCKVTVTGHSLGATIASMATMSLLGSGIDVTTFTFGQTRTGNQAYADFVDKRAPAGVMFRVTHSNDGVPQVFSIAKGFQHHSTEFWQESDNAVPEETFQCQGQETEDCNNSVRGAGVGPGGIGINAAHSLYLGVKIGEPTDRGAEICGGKKPGLVGTVAGLLGKTDKKERKGRKRRKKDEGN